MTNDEILAEAEARANARHDNPTEEDFQAAEDEVRAELGDGLDEDEDPDGLIPVDGNITLSEGRCQITINIPVRNTPTLGDALNTVASSLGRYGLDPFYILAIDPATGERWVVHGDRVFQEPADGEG